MIINKIFRNMNTQIRRTWSNLTQIQNKTQIKQDKSIGNKRAQSTNRSRNIKNQNYSTDHLSRKYKEETKESWSCQKQKKYSHNLRRTKQIKRRRGGIGCCKKQRITSCTYWWDGAESTWVETCRQFQATRVLPPDVLAAGCASAI